MTNGKRIDDALRHCATVHDCTGCGYGCDTNSLPRNRDLLNDAADALEQVQRRGEWIEDAMRIKCSVCGTDFNDEVTCCSDCYRWPWSYCPLCGAKMEVSEDA